MNAKASAFVKVDERPKTGNNTNTKPRPRAIVNPGSEVRKCAEMYAGRVFKNIIFSVFTSAEKMSNADILKSFVEIRQRMGAPLITSSDISSFESNNHHGIKDVLIATLREKFKTHFYRRCFQPNADIFLWF